MDSEVVFEWFFLLDDLDYYELFRIPRTATYDDVKHAFHEFAETFHPDQHVTRTAEEKLALDAIFKRGTEAYAVLCDATLRAEYDAQFAPVRASHPPERSPSVAPPPTRQSSIPSAPPRASDHAAVRTGKRSRLSDHVKNASAVPHARRAEELLEEGELRLAREQLAQASKIDPDNDLLRAYLRHIDAELKKG